MNVILDAVNYSNKGRLYYYEESKEYDGHILVYDKKPLEVLRAQNKKRDSKRWVPDDVVVSFFNKFEEPDEAVRQKFEVLVVE